MQDKNLLEERTTKTIRFENQLIEQINKLREGTERNFSQQVKYMLKKYIEIVQDEKWK